MFNLPATSEIITGSYSLGLVALSYAIAVVASFVALDLFANIDQVPKKFVIFWATGCGFCMGGGIWSMHFIGMLAFKLPISVNYDVLLTLISFGIAVFATGLAFFISNRLSSLITKIVPCGVLMGIGVAAMHYTGMGAMLMKAVIYYDFGLFALSILIAVVASVAVMWLTILHMGKYYSKPPLFLKLLSSLVMGAAIAGMHYTGMAAALIAPDPDILFESKALNTHLLAWFIATVNILTLGAIIIASKVYKHFQEEELQIINAIKVFWMSNPDITDIYSVSPAYETIWGRPCESLMKNPAEWVDSIHPEDRERVLAFRNPNRIATGEFKIKYRILRPDGSMRWIQDRTYPIRDSSEKVMQIAGVAEDITHFPLRFINAPDDSSRSNNE